MAKAQQPPALKHGLTSHIVREKWSADVLGLAEAILGAPPHSSAVMEAAREAAEAILYLRRVQHCRILVLEEGTLRRCAPTDALRTLALQLSEALRRRGLSDCVAIREELRKEHGREWMLDIETVGIFILGDELGERSYELRRFADYERRAHSARRKALRRLDYERVEAERRHVAGEAPGRRAAWQLEVA